MQRSKLTFTEIQNAMTCVDFVAYQTSGAIRRERAMTIATIYATYPDAGLACVNRYASFF
jgi:hypothetical protein